MSPELGIVEMAGKISTSRGARFAKFSVPVFPPFSISVPGLISEPNTRSKHFTVSCGFCDSPSKVLKSFRNCQLKRWTLRTNCEREFLRQMFRLN